jgi:hypothetical protein
MSYDAGRRAPGIVSWPTGICSNRGLNMALYISGRENTNTLSAREWNTLAELRTFALAHGCTPAQFAYAVEVMGTQTKYVASYLLRHLFVSALASNRTQAA